MGSFAPQFMKGTDSIVAILSFGSLSVLAAIIPGTAHPPLIPPDTMKGTMEFP